MRGLALIIVLIAAISAPAHAADKRYFDIAAGPLASAVIELGRQAGVPIAMVGVQDGNIRARAVRGRFTVEQALQRLLAGTGFVARRTASGDYVVVRGQSPRPQPRPVRRSPPPPPKPTPPAKPLVADEAIVVTASKSETRLADYPGSIGVLALDGDEVTARPEGGTEILVDNMPVLAATSLGPGRNKLFARGLADSSFNGQSQAGLSLYFGELRLAYSGPDPDLNLFDVKRVEVLTGPQGTLYGAGALSGVVRIEPNAPSTVKAESRVVSQFSAVQHGALGAGIMGMVNLPLVSDRVGVRLVGYHTSAPGYIDDELRQLKDVNRVITSGLRGTARLDTAAGMTVDLGVVFQRINARDSQYSNDEANPLIKRTEVAQPYMSDFLMPSLTLKAAVGTVNLVSATAWSRSRGAGTSDVLGVVGYPETTRTDLFTHETRISGGRGAAQFIAGISYARNSGVDERSVTFLGLGLEQFRIERLTDDLALFGQVRLAATDGLSATFGGRLEYIHDERTTFDLGRAANLTASRSQVGLLPSAALAWKPRKSLLVFLAYRTGSRGGNVLPLPDPANPVVVRSEPDQLHSFEAGWRYSPSRALKLSTTLSYTRWTNLQSDLATGAGNFRTINIGSTEIWGLEANASVRPLAGVVWTSSIFLNNSPKLRIDPAVMASLPAGFLTKDHRLPNIAPIGLRTAVTYETRVNAGTTLRLAGTMRYYGPSVAEYETRQPGYVEMGAEARVAFAPWTITLGVTNLTDTRGNRFAIGNRFTKSFDEPQATPPQPRTIRIELQADF